MIVVVLPPPFGPTTAVTAPEGTSKLTRSTPRCLLRPKRLRYSLVRSRTSIGSGLALTEGHYILPLVPRLIIQAGKEVGREFIVADKMRLGRLETCAAHIEDENASREHAAIRFVKGRYYILDLNSKNGTLHNGKRVKQMPLVPGDRIGIGDTEIATQQPRGPMPSSSSPKTPRPAL